MDERLSKRTIARVLLAVMAVVSMSLAGGTAAAASQPQTATEYFNTLRSMEDLPIYQQYGELETIQSRALTEVQVGEFTDTDRTKLDAVIALIRSFSQANEFVENGSYERSFRSASHIEKTITTLKQTDETYGVLASLALNRYYERLGNRLSEEADAAKATPTEIARRRLAAEAFKRANEPEQAAEFVRQSERLQAAFDADMTFMNETEAQTNAFLGGCSGCTRAAGAIASEGLGVFGEYDRARSLHWDTVDARERADGHGLTTRAGTFASLASRTATVWSSLAIAASVMMLGYGVLAGLLFALVVWRIFVWKDTFESSNVDGVVAMGDGDA